MKFIDFLNEKKNETDITKESHKTVLTKEKAIELIKSKCDVKNYLYRGYKSGGDYLMFDGSKGSRVSPDSSNHHNIILDHIISNEYNEFSLRSKSTICTTDKGYADNYGEVYRVFPFKDIDVSVMGDSDIFDKRVEIGNASYSINGWNNIFDNMNLDNKSYNSFINGFKKYWDNMSSEFIDNLDEYFKLIKKTDDYDLQDVIKVAEEEIHDEFYGNQSILINSDNFDNDIGYLLYTIFMYQTDNINRIIENAYDPYELNMEVINVSDISKIKGSQEVWFSGKCVAIKESLWDEIKKDL